MSKLRLGTSGWSYDSWVGNFYPEDTDKSDMLEHYVTRFNSVEINATFYRLPFENMVKGWRNKAPDDFSYSAKGARRITHYNKLEDIDNYLERFLERMQKLKPALETILWQFPPSFKKNTELLENFANKLPEDQRFAFEFRDTSWLDEQVYRLLSDTDNTIVWVSSSDMPDDCVATSDYIYTRFHGLEDGYTYAYSRSELEPWAEVIQQNMDKGKDAYVYFNNTGGHATECVEMMHKMLDQG